MIDLEDLIVIEEIEILIGTDVTAEPTGCIPSSTPVPEGIDVDVTNNNPTAKRYQVFMYDGTVEGGESPEFTFPEEPSTESDIEFVLPYNTEEFDRYWGMTDNVTVVRVEVVQLSLMPGSESIVVFDKEVTICEEDANAQLAEAAAEYAAEVAAEEAAQALIEAQEAAEAAEQALAEAQEAAEAAEVASAEDATEAAAAAAAAAEEAAQAAIAQAQAETEAAEAALAQAEAEKELALAQVETEKAKADAMLAQANEEGTSENTPEDTSSETSDEELAVGEDFGEHSKSGMSGVVLGLIIVLGLVGVGAVTGAVLNLRKQR
jgi:flagellar biosynthesis GTPase FlhF